MYYFLIISLIFLLISKQLMIIKNVLHNKFVFCLFISNLIYTSSKIMKWLLSEVYSNTYNCTRGNIYEFVESSAGQILLIIKYVVYKKIHNAVRNGENVEHFFKVLTNCENGFISVKIRGRNMLSNKKLFC